MDLRLRAAPNVGFTTSKYVRKDKGDRPVGSVPCLFKWPPNATKPAWAKVDKGV